MSLCLAFSNANAVVMSADRRVMTTVGTSSKGEQIKYFLQTDNEKKLFLCPKNRGLAYAGSSNLSDNTPISFLIEQLLKLPDLENLSLSDFLSTMLECIAWNLASSSNTVLIAADYSGSCPIILSGNTSDRTIHNHLCETSGNPPFVFSGENDLAKTVVEAVPTDRATFPVVDMISYVRFVTATVSEIQRFGQVPQTVSRDCDVLILTPDGAYWDNSNSSQK